MKNIIQVLFLIVLFTSCSNNNSSNNNLKENNDTNNIDTITTQVFKSNDGWGYDILINNKIHIHQTMIPAVNGIFTFESQEDAKKTAAFVVKLMLERNNDLPNVSIEQLDSLGVLDSTILNFQENIYK